MIQTARFFWDDVRHGMRVFVKMPLFTTTAVVSIAFGTGANVAIFSAVDALLLRPPVAVSRPHELMFIGSRVDRGLGTELRMSYPDYANIRDRANTFQGLAAYTLRWIGFAPHPQTAARIKVAALVSANYFDVLGVAPQLGRTFLPDEDRVPGRDAVAMLSDDTWQREFGRDPGVIGQTVRIAGRDFTVVGVTPESFNGLDPFRPHDLYLPLAMWPTVMPTASVDPLEDRSLRLLTVTGRLTAGATGAGARVQLAALGSDLERMYPATNANQPVSMQTETQMRFERRPLDTHTLVLLTLLSVAVLCIASANVAGLLASRAPARTREIALRLSLGASRSRIVTQLLAESVAIAVMGGLAGVTVGYAGILVLGGIEWPTEVVTYPMIQMDHRTLWFALAAATTTVFVFGLGPAIQTARLDLAHAMKTNDAGPSRRGRLVSRRALVAGQVAVSLAVMTIATFVFQIFERTRNAGPGFRTTQVAMVRLDPTQARHSVPDAQRLFERVLDDAQHLPGVVSAALASEVPMWGLEIMSMAPEGYQLPEGQTSVRVYGSIIDEHFFDTMNIPVLYGRAFRQTDTADAPRVAIVNEAVARRYWPGQNVVGRRFRLGNNQGPWIEIVGVAKMSTYVYSGEPELEVAYFPFRQEPRGALALLVQTAGESAPLLGPLRDMVRGLDADVPLFDAQTMEHFYAARANISGLAVALIGALGVMALILAVVGLYGLVSYDVRRRTREIGVRMAIGASPARVLAQILREGMRPAWVGLAAGLILSLISARALPVLVPIGARYDATTVLAVVPLILAVTGLAAGIPARLAARVDPTIALRCD